MRISNDITTVAPAPGTAPGAGPDASRQRSPRVTSSSYIPTLDGWRAIAVGLVIGAHCYTMLMNNGSRLAVLLAGLFSHAGYGVDIFFALSGYLICTLLLKEKQRTGTISLSRFYLRRVFRILPPMLLYVGVVFALSRVHILPVISTVDVLAVVFFARNYVMGSWYTGHFWSLAVEEHFYAVAPVFFLLLPWKKALRAAVALAAVCIFIRWYEFSHHLFAYALPQFRTENRFDALLWGAILALLLHQEKTREWLRQRLTGVVCIAVLAGAVLALNLLTSQPSRRTIVAFALPLIIGYTVLHPTGLFGRFLEQPVLRWIGRLSYSLYIWQMLFLTPDARPLGLLQAFPLALLCPFICATLSYYLVEKPAIRFGHRIAASPGLNAENLNAAALDTAGRIS